MTGPLTRPIVAFVKATSSAVELRPYCAAMHSYPSACRGTINLLKQEPSAQSPWQNTMLGLVCVDCDFISSPFLISTTSAMLRTATRRLRLDERAEHRGPPSLEVDFPLESAIQQSLDSLLRFGPSQRGLKRSNGLEEPVGRRQRDMVDEILRGGDSTPVEGGDPARERVDEALQLRVRKCAVDVSISFRSVAVEVVRAQNDFERPTATDQMWKTFCTPAAGMQSYPDFGLAESRVLARREAHVAGEDDLAAHAPDTASYLRDADHWGLGETHERIHQDREARSPDSCHDVSYLAGQIKVGKVKLGVRAFEYDDPQARSGVHSREQIL